MFGVQGTSTWSDEAGRRTQLLAKSFFSEKSTIQLVTGLDQRMSVNLNRNLLLLHSPSFAPFSPQLATPVSSSSPMPPSPPWLISSCCSRKDWQGSILPIKLKLKTSRTAPGCLASLSTNFLSSKLKTSTLRYRQIPWQVWKHQLRVLK